MHGGRRTGAGRHSIRIDPNELEKLCMLQCTHEEIAAWFGCSIRTVEKWERDAELGEVMRRGRAKGRISVRRAQMQLLEDGNSTVAIWLGKQLLGQRDVMPVELSGTDGKAMQISLEVVDELFAQSKKTRKGK